MRARKMALIDEDRVTKALQYLAMTDTEAAKAKAKAEVMKKHDKTVKAYGFLDASGTVAEREAKSVTTDQWRKYEKDLQEAIVDSETMQNKRDTEKGIVEVWRTEQANRRKGNI